MKILKRIRKQSLKALQALHVFALIAGLLASPISEALQIELKTAMKIRQFDDDSAALNAVGVLAAGSVVEIPDRFKKMKHGRIDSAATLENWLKSAGYRRSAINSKVKDPRLDFYFPVHIVKLAPGSTGKHLIGTTRFMALRVLQRSDKGLIVKARAHAYYGTKGFVPLKPGMEVPSIASAPATKPAAAASVASPAYSPDQQATPAAQENAQDNSPPEAQTSSQPDPQSQTEADTSSSDDCPTCDAARDEANSGAAPASNLGSRVRDEISPAIYNSEANGMQGLTSGFEAQCSNFIKRDGTYGPWGQKVLQEIAKHPAYMADSNRTAGFCPNFNSFNDDQKRHFWVWVMASVASQEASCSMGAYASLSMNPNGHAVGLFQIEERAGLRAGRDQRYGGRFCSGDPWDTSVNIRCGVKMIEDTIDNGNGPYARQNNYYASLLYNGKAHRLISHYAACGASESRSYGSRRVRHHRRSHRARSAK